MGPHLELLLNLAATVPPSAQVPELASRRFMPVTVRQLTGRLPDLLRAIDCARFR